MAIYTQASFGYAIGDRKRTSIPPLCDILLCDGYDSELIKLRIPDLAISRELMRFRTGLACERRISSSSWTVNIQLDAASNDGINAIRYDHEEILGVKDYSICPICFWENDPVQNENPDYEGGAKNVSLRVGQHNFLVFGACEPTMKAYVRPPLNDESKDPSWKPIE